MWVKGSHRRPEFISIHHNVPSQEQQQQQRGRTGIFALVVELKLSHISPWKSLASISDNLAL